MYIDSHAHVFQHWGGGACGHASRSIHLSYLRKIGTGPAGKIFRVSDGTEVSSSGLFRDRDFSWNGFVDANFWVGQFGQLNFSLGGEDYYIQYMPVSMKDLECPPELLVAHMVYAGIDHCVLQAGGAYGSMNDYNAFAQNQYAGRFTGLMNVDEGAADSPAMLAEVDRAYGRLGLRGLYFKADFSRYGYARNFNDRDFDVFWERIVALDIPVFLEIAATPHFDKPSYIAQLERLGDLVGRYRGTRWLLVMPPPVKHFASDGTWNFPPEIMRVLRAENLMIELTFPITYGALWDYPYPEAQSLIRQLRDAFGASKLVWGTDMPNVERFCTYRQSIDYIRRYCAFLTSDEKDRILGGNVAELICLSRRAAT
jgi:predicted TIM-barrel fold metal-dependent hydrolase